MGALVDGRWVTRREVRERWQYGMVELLTRYTLTLSPLFTRDLAVGYDVGIFGWLSTS